MVNTTKSTLHVIVSLSKTFQYTKPSFVAAFTYLTHSRRMLAELEDPQSPIYDDDDRYWVVHLEPGEHLEDKV